MTAGRSTDLMIGEWVVALGNPYAYLLGNAEPTVTVGVVSATGRNILPSGEQTGLYLDMIQTDAAINPGQLGRPADQRAGRGRRRQLLDLQQQRRLGRARASPFPIERALRVADEIIRSGSVRRAWVGLDVEGADGDARLEEPRAASWWRPWRPAGPPAKAGPRAGRRAGRGQRAPAPQLPRLGGGEARPPRGRRGRASRCGAAQATARRRVVTGDLPTVTAEKFTVLQDLELVKVTPAVRAERGIRSEAGALIFQISPQVSRRHRAPARAT